MGFTDVQICNMALGHLGHTKFIAALTERSLAADLCGLYYEPARNYVLEDYPWPEATKYAALGLVEEDPNDDWDYSYRYPSDCLFARRLVTEIGRIDPNPPAFKTGIDDQGRLIYSDEEDAVLEYTKLLDDPQQYRPTLGVAISWYLAGLLAPGLAKDRKQATMCFQMYEIVKTTAQSRAGNEQQQATEPESEAIRARE